MERNTRNTVCMPFSNLNNLIIDNFEKDDQEMGHGVFITTMFANLDADLKSFK